MMIISEYTLCEIAYATDYNDHNDAVMILAEALGDQVAVSAMEHIQRIHERFGYMPADMMQMRDRIRRALISEVSNQNEVSAAF